MNLGLSNTYYLENGKLYYCENENEECDEITEVGYYINDKENAYACKSNGSSIICEKVTITVDPKDGCSNNIGKLIVLESKLSICLASDKSIELNNVNTGNYIVENGSNDIFGIVEGGYAIITVNEKSVILNKEYDNKLKYVYVNNENKSLKVMEKGNTCPKDASKNNAIKSDDILELECENGICT